jgi:DNA-binding transcriptional ArsR family regulator
MQAFMVSHLRHMWERYMAPEWERVKPMLKDSVSAFQELDFKGMSNLEAAQLITDQELDTCLQELVGQAKRIVFAPNAHIGPYLTKFRYPNDTLGIIFGARLPRGAKIQAPDLSRNEILVRLSALADDNRLCILKYIAEHGEQRSQDIMEALEFSQSATSRHLGLLSATGYLVERRCEGAKCYVLNPARLDETLEALRGYLLGEDTPAYSARRERIKSFA